MLFMLLLFPDKPRSIQRFHLLFVRILFSLELTVALFFPLELNILVHRFFPHPLYPFSIISPMAKIADNFQILFFFKIIFLLKLIVMFYPVPFAFWDGCTAVIQGIFSASILVILSPSSLLFLILNFLYSGKSSLAEFLILVACNF